ncbi:MAG: alpha-L-fucosidase, partial [Bacteroidales bacterium]|nr:alpha-L-fucosidase [Bacteroidales bacterium]
HGNRQASANTQPQVSILLTDSRSLTFANQTLFFALETDKGDGHKYIPVLYAKGVRAFVVSRSNKEFPRSIGMLDHEMSNPEEPDPEPWLCDYTISTGYHSSWGYVRGMQYRSHIDIVHKLVEVVSNNGCLLMNLSPMADGTFPQAQRDIMENVGVWLWSYGESIYGTRPCLVSHETLPGGERVFFTRKDGALYLIFLDWPGKGVTLDLKALNSEVVGGRIERATLLSVKRNFACPFQQRADGLALTIPQGARLPSDAAQVVRLDLQ